MDKKTRVLKVVSTEGYECNIREPIMEEGSWQGSIAADGTKSDDYWPSGHYEAYILDPALIVEVEEGPYKVYALLSLVYRLGGEEKTEIFQVFEAACPEWRQGRTWHNLKLWTGDWCYVAYGKKEELEKILESWHKPLVQVGDQHFFTHFNLAWECYKRAYSCCQNSRGDQKDVLTRQAALALQHADAYKYEKLLRLYMPYLPEILPKDWPLEIAKTWSAIRLVKDLEEGKWKKEIEEKIMEDPRTKGFEFALKK